MYQVHSHQRENIAWLQCRLRMNQLAKDAGVITGHMYNYAKECLQKELDALEKVYNTCQDAC